MFLRFSVAEIDRDSERGTGIFQVAGQLVERPWLPSEDRDELDRLRIWFKKHLKVPTRFTAAKPPHYRKQQRAISWFRDSATDHISKMYEMKSIIERHGIMVNVLKSQRVGYIVYEDEFQVVAEPFADVVA